MNTSAEKHLAKAVEYAAKGEEYYRKTAEEILAAQAADPTLTQRQAGKVMGRSETWISEILSSFRRAEAPYSGSAYAERKAVNHTKKILREAPLEQVEQMIAELSDERKQALRAAVGDRYAQARHDYNTEQRHMTPAQREERRAAGEAMTRPVVAWSTGMQLLSSLEGAHLYLRELIEGGEIPTETMLELGKWMRALNDEYQVARAMVGLPIDLDEVQA